MKKRVADKFFEKKLVTGNVCYHYNTWVTGVYMSTFYRKKPSQIEWSEPD